MSELIEKALEDSTDTRAVIVAEGALAQVPALFSECFPGKAAIVVADERTMTVAGNAVLEGLRSAGVQVSEPYVFPGEPELYAKYENCEVLRDALRDVDAVAIAVGAGTLNDIVKRAVSELDRTYMQVGTAASMDGYTAFGSSIAKGGFKQTLSCPAPLASVSDLTVMAAAPQVMTASGYGDLIGKVPAGADWMIADALGIEEIDEGVWDLVQGPLAGALAQPDALASGDVAATEALAEGLVMSGLAMQAHQSSRPASGAEHQFSHLWEMEGFGVDVTPRRLSHGFKVGLGTVSICALYELLLERDILGVDAEAAVAGWPSREDAEAAVRAAHPDPKLVEDFVGQQMDKWRPADQIATRIRDLQQVWPALSDKIRGQLLPAAEIQQRLRAVGAPAHPEDIGLDWQRFKDTYTRAQMIRKRYTVLDTVLELGILSELVEELFSSNGFWGRQAPGRS